MPGEYQSPVLALLTRDRAGGEKIRRYLDYKGIPSKVEDINIMVKDPNWYLFFLGTYRPQVLVFDINSPLSASFRDYTSLRLQDPEVNSRNIVLRTAHVERLKDHLAFQDLSNAVIIGNKNEELLEQTQKYRSQKEEDRGFIPYPSVDPELYRLSSI